MKNWKVDIGLNATLLGEIAAITLYFSPMDLRLRGSENTGKNYSLHKNPL